ncbi:MAG: xanthine dehydrogenase family protein subunit M [Proteobacteria bacterium]|nr:xanthine dehydrogenase family protein subunit M [Pseudomonadota bacterium]
MKPAAFAYARARSVEHAISLLGEHQGDARLLAGGQSLIATLNMRLSSPSLLVDINRLPDLGAISVTAGIVEFGALVRHVQAEQSETVARYAPLIARAMPHIAHPAIRNRGTIGGSIAFADPAAELPACIVALGGELEIAGPHGRRSVSAEAFFKGMFETELGPHDLLTAIRVPAADAKTRAGFAELARRHGDYALTGLAACARATAGGLSDVHLAYFGVGTMPVRARNAEAALDAGDIENAVRAIATDLDPAGDLHASAELKSHLAGVLLRRVFRQLSEQPT